jgi:hypothetical protein
MDLPRLARTVARHRVIATLGLLAAIALALLSYVRVDPFGDPAFRYRSEPIWASRISLQIHNPGFREGSIRDPSQQAVLAGLAPL